MNYLLDIKIRNLQTYIKFIKYILIFFKEINNEFSKIKIRSIPFKIIQSETNPKIILKYHLKNNFMILKFIKILFNIVF